MIQIITLKIKDLMKNPSITEVEENIEEEVSSEEEGNSGEEETSEKEEILVKE